MAGGDQLPERDARQPNNIESGNAHAASGGLNILYSSPAQPKQQRSSLRISSGRQTVQEQYIYNYQSREVEENEYVKV